MRLLRDAVVLRVAEVAAHALDLLPAASDRLDHPVADRLTDRSAHHGLPRFTAVDQVTAVALVIAVPRSIAVRQATAVDQAIVVDQASVAPVLTTAVPIREVASAFRSAAVIHPDTAASATAMAGHPTMEQRDLV